MENNLPATIHNRFRLPAHPSGMPVHPIPTLYHKQGAYVVGSGQGTAEPPASNTKSAGLALAGGASRVTRSRFT